MGFAKKTKDRSFTKLGTLDFMAPEILAGSGYSSKIDIWAFGILICELISGQSPLANIEDPIKLYERILSGNYHLPKYLGALELQLVKTCL